MSCFCPPPRGFVRLIIKNNRIISGTDLDTNRALQQSFWPGGLPGGKLAKKIAALRVYPANHVLRKTVAPVAPPSSFVPLDFLETLVSYKHQAFDLGWIDNQGIVNSLDAKLDNVKKQLEKGKTKQAINALFLTHFRQESLLMQT